MGMFDWVHFKMVCPTCNNMTDMFQSKDVGCMCDTVQPEDIDNFYSYCKCGTWIEFNRNPMGRSNQEQQMLSIDEIKALGFTMKTRKIKEGV